METEHHNSQFETLVLSPFAFYLPSTHPTHRPPTSASSLDYGFDFDEQELGRELLASQPASLDDQPNHLIEAEEFESLYRWFNS